MNEYISPLPPTPNRGGSLQRVLVIDDAPSCAACSARFCMSRVSMWPRRQTAGKETDGLATRRELRRLKPALLCCIVGDSAIANENAILASGAVCVLAKPFGLEQLADPMNLLCGVLGME